MKINSLVSVINASFKFVIDTSIKYNIDESHSLKHSIETFKYANNIYRHELTTYPILKEQKDIIFVSSIIHDMCDKKYITEMDGLKNINNYFNDYMSQDKIDIIKSIISSMSYSKVKVNGYPELNEYQMAYHIVREADLLASYDIDRCIIYGMYRENLEYFSAINRAEQIFNERVFNYLKDKLFVTNYSKYKSIQLDLKASISIKTLEKIKQNIQDEDTIKNLLL